MKSIPQKPTVGTPGPRRPTTGELLAALIAWEMAAHARLGRPAPLEAARKRGRR